MQEQRRSFYLHTRPPPFARGKRETWQRRVQHRFGWAITKFLYRLHHLLGWPSRRMLDWNLAMHDWMERRGVCCPRHGYHDEPEEKL